MNAEAGELNDSFLDTLTCGLGGMLLMLLILATLSHIGSRDSQSAKGSPLDQPALEAPELEGDSPPPEPPRLLRIQGTVNKSNGGWVVAKESEALYLALAGKDSLKIEGKEGIPICVDELLSSSTRTRRTVTDGKVELVLIADGFTLTANNGN